jgi:hypothetical protein
VPLMDVGVAITGPLARHRRPLIRFLFISLRVETEKPIQSIIQRHEINASSLSRMQPRHPGSVRIRRAVLRHFSDRHSLSPYAQRSREEKISLGCNTVTGLERSFERSSPALLIQVRA